jgi:hypothetical protein
MVTPTRVSYGGATEQVSGELVSGSFFPMLRVRPIIGRLFSREDDRTVSGAPYAVLASAYWQARFPSDPAVAGKSVSINSDTCRSDRDPDCRGGTRDRRCGRIPRAGGPGVARLPAGGAAGRLDSRLEGPTSERWRTPLLSRPLASPSGPRRPGRIQPKRRTASSGAGRLTPTRTSAHPWGSPLRRGGQESAPLPERPQQAARSPPPWLLDPLR